MRVGIATDHGGFSFEGGNGRSTSSGGPRGSRFRCSKPEPRRRLSGLRHSARPGRGRGQGRTRGSDLRQRRRRLGLCQQDSRHSRGLIHDHFSARQGVEDDHMNILCMGGRTVGPAVAWDLVQTFLAARVQPSRASSAPPEKSGSHRKIMPWPTRILRSYRPKPILFQLSFWVVDSRVLTVRER